MAVKNVKTFLCRINGFYTREEVFNHINNQKQTTFVEKCIVAIVNDNIISVFLQYNKPVTKQHVESLLTPYGEIMIETILEEQYIQLCLYLTGLDDHVLYRGLSNNEIAFIATLRNWVSVTPHFSVFDHFVQQHADKFSFIKQYHFDYYQQLKMDIDMVYSK